MSHLGTPLKEEVLQFILASFFNVYIFCVSMVIFLIKRAFFLIHQLHFCLLELCLYIFNKCKVISQIHSHSPQSN